MKITLTRIEATDHGVFGKLETEGFSCVTLERHDICIPTGTYQVILYTSPVHGLVPLLQGIHGRDMIEMHEGNFEYNSKGCILVGKSRGIIEGVDGITASRDTLKQLVQLLQAHPQGISISIS